MDHSHAKWTTYRGPVKAARAIDAEIRTLIQEANDRARAVLDSGDALQRVAEVLLEKETLSAVELEALASPVTGPG